MEVLEAIQRRRSIRRFLPEPVDCEVLRGLLDISKWAPSSVNSQPWEFTVIQGAVLDATRSANVGKFRNGGPAETELHTSDWPKDSVFRERQVEIAKQLFSAMEIARDDKEKRSAWTERGFRYFDAPVAIIITYDKVLSPRGPLMDIGGAVQTLCLAAMQFGLGTCILEQGVMYSSVVRELANIPDTKKLAISIAVGYPDWSFPANQVVSKREDIDHIVHWVE